MLRPDTSKSVQNTISKVITVDPSCWPSTAQPETVVLKQSSPPQKVDPTPEIEVLAPSDSMLLEPLPRFPNSLFHIKEYDGAKAITAIFLTLSSLYLLAGFFGFMIDHTSWLHDLLYPQADLSSSPHSVWQSFWHPIGSTLHQLASYVDLAVRLFIFVCTYCLAWATFDPRNIEGYVMGFFNTLLGVVYVFSPLDTIPDILPVVGTLDDAFLGVGVLALGLSSIYRNKTRDIKTHTILELIDDGNNQKALTMLLEDKGITVQSKQ